jgi:hypothetical protein
MHAMRACPARTKDGGMLREGEAQISLYIFKPGSAFISNGSREIDIDIYPILVCHHSGERFLELFFLLVSEVGRDDLETGRRLEGFHDLIGGH